LALNAVTAAFMAAKDIQEHQDSQVKTETISLPGKRTGWRCKRGDVWEADYRLNDGRRNKKCFRKWIKDDAIAWLRAEALGLQDQGNPQPWPAASWASVDKHESRVVEPNSASTSLLAAGSNSTLFLLLGELTYILTVRVRHPLLCPLFAFTGFCMYKPVLSFRYWWHDAPATDEWLANAWFWSFSGFPLDVTADAGLLILCSVMSFIFKLLTCWLPLGKLPIGRNPTLILSPQPNATYPRVGLYPTVKLRPIL